MAVDTRKIAVRPQIKAKETKLNKELLSELRDYTRELQAKLNLLDSAIVELQSGGDDTEYSEPGHTHTISDITGLQDALDQEVQITLSDASAADVVVQLPKGKEGLKRIIKKTDSSSNAVVVTPAVGETIDSSSTISLTTQDQSISIVWQGVEWRIY